MGAGTCIEHYMQDAAECYWVYICQEALEKLGLNISSVKERKDEFDDYCLERNISVCFLESDYKKNMDLCCNNFINNLVARYPGKRIDLTNVESEYRNKGKI